MKATAIKLLSVIAMAMSAIQFFFVGMASYTIEKVPISVSLLGWVLKILLMGIFFTSFMILVFINNIAMGMLILFSYLMAIIHIMFFIFLKITPFSDNGIILYSFLIGYLLIAIALKVISKRQDRQHNSLLKTDKTLYITLY